MNLKTLQTYWGSFSTSTQLQSNTVLAGQSSHFQTPSVFAGKYCSDLRLGVSRLLVIMLSSWLYVGSYTLEYSHVIISWPPPEKRAALTNSSARNVFIIQVFFLILQHHSSLGHLHSLAIPGVHQAPTDRQVGCPSYTTQHSYDQACSVGTREPICHPLEYNYTHWLCHGQALLIRSWKFKLSPNVSKSIRNFWKKSISTTATFSNGPCCTAHWSVQLWSAFFCFKGRTNPWGTVRWMWCVHTYILYFLWWLFCRSWCECSLVFQILFQCFPHQHSSEATLCQLVNSATVKPHLFLQVN